MSASILKDGNKFFLNVLNDKEFQKKGVLTRTEGRVSWGVVDPRRHIMTIWEKDTFDFVVAAKSRNATLISNGPFYKYSGGPKWWAVAKYTLDAFISGIGIGSADKKTIIKERRRLFKKHFSGEIAEGYIYGDSEKIVRTDESRPKAHYFGRKQGRTFAHYEVNKGDPPKIPEVIGGLFRSVQNYSPVDKGVASQVGAWGLAPILSAPKTQLDIFKKYSLNSTLSQYEKALMTEQEGFIPVGTGGGKQVDGLIIALFGGGSPNGFAKMLSNVLVKEAVRVDGNSSILLGNYGTILQGSAMNGPKRTYNTHGYMFKAG